MQLDRSFKTALLFSALGHLLILFPLSAFSIIPRQKVLNELEVNYLKAAPKSRLGSGAIKFKAASSNDLDKIGLKQRVVLSGADKIPSKVLPVAREPGLNNQLAVLKSTFQKPDLFKDVSMPRQDIKLTSVEPIKSQSPAYLSYQNFIRENFRRYLYNRYSDIDERGEVYLAFVLSADGTLKDSQVIDAKSNASNRLKRIVLEGLRDASPFPAIPRELSSPVVTFSVTVQFLTREETE